MPLSDPIDRELLHLRTIDIRGYRRADGMVDVEARLADTKTYGFALEERGRLEPGDKLHGMAMRMTVDRNLLIVACEAATDHGPYSICPTGAANYGRLAGLTIKPGFLKAARDRIGATEGCTHLSEMLQQVATVAMQTMYSLRDKGAAKTAEGDSARALFGTCSAFAPSSPVVKRRWPDLFVPATPESEAAESTAA